MFSKLWQILLAFLHIIGNYSDLFSAINSTYFSGVLAQENIFVGPR
jgi:hypothetical protein